jgi:hypothetical protein
LEEMNKASKNFKNIIDIQWNLINLDNWLSTAQN